MPTDQLLFLDTKGQRLWIATWAGPWPPPERLIVMKGGQSGQMAVVEEAIVRPEVLAEARRLGTIEELRFKLRNCSAIEHAAPEGARWFRGAEYVPEGDDA